MTVPEFKSADKVEVEPWERQQNRTLNDALRLFDTIYAHSKEDAKEGDGYTIEIQVGIMQIKYQVEPQNSRATSTPPFKHVESPPNTGQPISQGITKDSLRAALKAAGVPDAGVAIELVDGRLTVKSGKLTQEQFNAFKNTVKDKGLHWDSVNKAWYAEVSL